MRLPVLAFFAFTLGKGAPSCLHHSRNGHPEERFENCLATKEDAGSSWVQMSRKKLEGSTSNADGYFYSKRSGDARGSNSISWPSPQSLSRPSWVWENELDEQVRHSPLIDAQRNIYVATTTRIRKFSPAGELLWVFHQDEPCDTSPAMGRGLIYFLTSQTRGKNFKPGYGHGHVRVYGVSMETGKAKLNVSFPINHGTDAGSLLLSGEHLFVSALVNAFDGSDTLLALNASSGEHLWNFTTDDVLWNLSPVTPGDGTLLFASSCGCAFRLTFQGDLLWKSGPSYGPEGMCSTGGGVLGPNGLFYVAHGMPPDGQHHPDRGFYDSFHSGTHFLTAFDMDGAVVWRYQLEGELHSGQYPAVGRLFEGGPLAVVAAVGNNNARPEIMYAEQLEQYLSFPEYRRAQGVRVSKNAVLALDATTGMQIWRWDEKDWDHIGAAGDEEHVAQRAAHLDRVDGITCLPDAGGIPLINTKDGTVYAASSHGGNLTLLKNKEQPGGVIEPTEVAVFAAGSAFLNSPSSAPGMLVAAPCWGPMYVFKS